MLDFFSRQGGGGGWGVGMRVHCNKYDRFLFNVCLVLGYHVIQSNCRCDVFHCCELALCMDVCCYE